MTEPGAGPLHHVEAATEVATLFAFEPAAVAAFANADEDCFEGPRFQRMFREGRMVAWSTGTDGGHRVAIWPPDTEPPPFDAEAGPFRLRCKTGRLHVGGEEGLPNQPTYEGPPATLQVPPGTYRVRLGVVWHRPDVEGGYHLVLEPVGNLAAIEPPEDIPWLEPFPPRPPQPRGRGEWRGWQSHWGQDMINAIFRKNTLCTVV